MVLFLAVFAAPKILLNPRKNDKLFVEKPIVGRFCETPIPTGDHLHFGFPFHSFLCNFESNSLLAAS